VAAPATTVAEYKGADLGVGTFAALFGTAGTEQADA
jgi:hypothetical protein